MKPTIDKITESELKIMLLLWQTGHEMTITDIRKALTETTQWEPSTIKTLIYRLSHKGILRADKREVTYYTPLVSEQQYNDFAAKSMIDSLFGGSAKNLVSTLIDSKHLTRSDIDELRSLFMVDNSKEGD